MAMRKTFFTLHHCCANSLDKLETASLQTLNLMSLAAKFPGNRECLTALRLQHERERKARSDFLRRERALLHLMAEEEGFEPPNELPR